MNVVVRSPTIKENSPVPGSRNNSAMCPSTGNAATGGATGGATGVAAEAGAASNNSGTVATAPTATAPKDAFRKKSRRLERPAIDGYLSLRVVGRVGQR
jgi:hypothetical protein